MKVSKGRIAPFFFLCALVLAGCGDSPPPPKPALQDRSGEVDALVKQKAAARADEARQAKEAKLAAWPKERPAVLRAARAHLKAKRLGEVEALAKEWEVAKDAELEKLRREAHAAMLVAARAATRRLFGESLRNRFLDAGLDIKVTVSGAASDRVLLEYVLFSDVWRRKFETNGIAHEIRAAGFRRLDMRDGHGWAVYWDFME